VGDEVCKEVAHRLTAGVRAHDRVGRYGEEFLMVLPNCDLVSAFSRADQLRGLISRKAIQAGTVAPSITMSMALAVADATSNAAPEKLLHQADVGLYKASRMGGIASSRSTRMNWFIPHARSRRVRPGHLAGNCSFGSWKCKASPHWRPKTPIPARPPPSLNADQGGFLNTSMVAKLMAWRNEDRMLPASAVRPRAQAPESPD